MLTVFKKHRIKAALGYLIPILALTVLSKCSGDQSAQGGDPVQQGAGEEDTSSAALNAGQNAGAGANSAEASAQGAAMNNATDNSGGSGGNFEGANNTVAEGDNASGNASLNEPTTNENAALGASLNNTTTDSSAPSNIGNASLNSSTALNTSTPLNNSVNALSNGQGAAPPADATDAAPTPTVPAAQTAQPAAGTGDTSVARAAASPFTNPQMNWPGKGKVKYVTRSVTRHASPNGPVLGEFEQGDHPLIYQNGNWVELHDGSFVKGNGLSDKAVGYGKGRKAWH